MEEKKEIKKKKITKRLKNKYRLVIMNHDTFQERLALSLSPINVFTWGGLIFMLFVGLIYITIAYTSLREYIPGYADTSTKINAQYAAEKADSLLIELEQNNKWIRNLQYLLEGKDPSLLFSQPNEEGEIKPLEVDFSKSAEDSLLRAEVEKAERFSISSTETGKDDAGIRSFFFFTPISGTVSASFDAKAIHYGVDIAAKENEAIFAVVDGTVILATWTADAGHVIQIQHSNNLVSVYKHNSVLLKKEGDKIKAGTAIAIVGNSGEYTTGHHLHFELWYNGSPVDPQDYIVF